MGKLYINCVRANYIVVAIVVGLNVSFDFVSAVNCFSFSAA